MEPTKEIKWTITKGKHLLNAVPQLIGVKELNLTIRKDLKKLDLKGGLEIKASTKKIKEIEPINFEIVFPEGLTGEHIPTASSNGSIRDGCPPDGDPFPSASAQILVSIYPTDVSFSGIWVVEKDNGYFGEKSSLATKHNADSIWSVTEKNQLGIPDDIATQDSLGSLNETYIDSSGKKSYKHSYPNEFTWDCLFKTYSFNVVSREPLGVDDISNVKQSFYYDRRGDCFYIKVSKYDNTKEKGTTCSVERISGGNHIFKP